MPAWTPWSLPAPQREREQAAGSRGGSGGGRVPGLHAFVASARTALARAGPVGPVITKAGSTSGGACRGLCRTYLRSDHCGYSQRGYSQHRTESVSSYALQLNNSKNFKN
jgi:hypothetical protein